MRTKQTLLRQQEEARASGQTAKARASRCCLRGDPAIDEPALQARELKAKLSALQDEFDYIKVPRAPRKRTPVTSHVRHTYGFWGMVAQMGFRGWCRVAGVCAFAAPACVPLPLRHVCL